MDNLSTIDGLRLLKVNDNVIIAHQIKPPYYFSCCDGLILLPRNEGNQKTVILDLNIEPHLINQINSAHFEYGIKNEVDDYLVNSIERYGSLTRQWLEELFIEQFHSPYILCCILRTIAHFEYRYIKPQGMLIAISATRHVNAEVKECGIRCFENWGEPEALSILTKLDISEDWLHDYLEEVISYLKEIKSYAISG